MIFTSLRFLSLLINSSSRSLLDIIKIIKLKKTIRICKIIEKPPIKELRNAKAMIIKVDLKNTWYLNTATIDSE